MSDGTTIDGEPNTAAKALAIKRALIQTVADAAQGSIDNTTMALLNTPVDLLHMYRYGGGTTAHAATRGQQASARVGNFNVAQVESHLADIDKQIIKLGGT